MLLRKIKIYEFTDMLIIQIYDYVYDVHLNKIICEFQTVLMAVVSFCEVDFSYDRGFLQDALRESHQSLKWVNTTVNRKASTQL